MTDTSSPSSTKEMTPKAAAAFAEYVAMGDGRSLEKLAASRVRQKLYKNSSSAIRTIAKWSSDYRWQDRIRSATTKTAEQMLAEAAELDADTFVKTSRRLNQMVSSSNTIDPGNLTRIRESVRRAESKSIDVKHSGTIKHAHHDMSAFTDEEIEALAAIAERQSSEASA